MSYTTIKLPNELVQKIDAYIKHSDDGYTSRTDFIKGAVREFFKDNNFNINNYQKKEGGEEKCEVTP